MTSKRIIVLTLCVLAILVLGSLTATILYYYHHPSALKTLMERAVSRSTGTSFTMKALSFSISPLRIEAKGIILKPGEDQHGFQLEIPDLKVDMALVGRFGHRRLSLSNVKVADFSLRLFSDMALPEISPGDEGPPSLFSRALQWMIQVFLFRGVALEAAEADNGEITFQSGDHRVEMSNIQARISPEHGVDVLCSARAESPGEKMHLVVPCVHIASDHDIYPVDQEIHGRLRVNSATFESPHGNIQGIDITLSFIYDHGREELAFDPMHIGLDEITPGPVGEGGSVSTDLEFTAQGFFDLAGNQVDISRFHVACENLLELTGKVNLGLGADNSVRMTNLDGHLLPQQCMSILHQAAEIPLLPVSLSGPVNLHGHIEGMKEEQAWRWQGDAEVVLSQNRYSYVTEQMRSTGMISGNLRAVGSFPDIDLSVSLKGDEITFSGMGVTLKPFRTSASLSGQHPVHRREETSKALSTRKTKTEKDFTVKLPRPWTLIRVR